jgi:hypothetical protein
MDEKKLRWILKKWGGKCGEIDLARGRDQWQALLKMVMPILAVKACLLIQTVVSVISDLGKEVPCRLSAE